MRAKFYHVQPPYGSKFFPLTVVPNHMKKGDHVMSRFPWSGSIYLELKEENRVVSWILSSRIKTLEMTLRASLSLNKPPNIQGCDGSTSQGEKNL